MKNRLLVILMAPLVLVLTVPALAVDVDFFGEYRVRAFYNDNPLLQKDGEDDSAAWLDHRFRLETVFKANENISLTTRLDVLDEEPFGDEMIFFDGNEGNDGDDIDVDALYLTVISSVGMFKVGRIPGGSTWGTDLADSGIDFAFDRVEYFAKTGDLIFGGVYEKLTEDNYLGAADFGNEGDCDTFYLFGLYQKENLEAGMALRYQDLDEIADLIDNMPLKEIVDLYSASGTDITALATSPLVGYPANSVYYMDLRQSVPATSPLGLTLGAANGLPAGTGIPIAASPLAAAISSIYYGYDVVQNFALAPYVKADFGTFRIEAELIYEAGEFKASNRGITFIDSNMAPVMVGDRDINALTYNVAAFFDMGDAGFNLGFASAQGQDYSELLKPKGDITIGNLMYHGLGDDFRPLLILTNDVGGQPLNNGYTTMLSGVDLLYAGASYALTDTLTLRGAIGQAWANEDDYSGGKDDFGFEIDLGLTLKFMSNLTYMVDIGYLDKGDEILAGTTLLPAAGDGDATFAVYNEIKLTF